MLPRPLPIELHATIWTQNASPDPDVADSSGSNGHAVSPRNLTSREEGGGEHGPDAGSDHHGTPEQPFSRRLEQVEVEEKQRRLSAYRAIMERWYRHLQALLGKTDIAMHVIVPGPCPKLEDFRNLRLSPEKYELTVDEEEDALREWSDNCLWWWGEIKMLNDKTASAVNVAARANAPFQTTSCSPDHMTGDRGGDMFVVTSSDHVEPLWFNHPPPYLVGANANGGDGDLLLMETLRGSQQGQLMLDEDKLTEACGRQLLMEIDEDEE
ncbi:unnamed protein product [Phytomonas sp. EM1]|nr:unnamed protein product [Phytomonas sp. EM1]|eukprot:CCW65770.1 unnamed protein product [Phytomonas sp. isolate EM1]